MKAQNIPSDDDLHRRVYPNLYDHKKRKFAPGAYELRYRETYLSVNWERYSTPKESAICPNGKKFYVAGLYARVPRSEELQVNHDPGRFKAHTKIEGLRLTISRESQYEVAARLADESRPLVTTI